MGNHRSDGSVATAGHSFMVLAWLMLSVLASPSAAAADPVRITVNFEVVGSSADPDFGGATASGSFSVVTTQELGTEVLLPEGFGATAISFTWGGTTWNTTNADVYLINRAPSGRIAGWAVGGSPSGFSGISPLTSPDFRMAFCNTDDFMCSFSTFEYSTARSAELGVFTGFIPFFSIERQPVEDAAVPEPMTFLLVGGGVCAIAARRAKLPLHPEKMR